MRPFVLSFIQLIWWVLLPPSEPSCTGNNAFGLESFVHGHARHCDIQDDRYMQDCVEPRAKLTLVHHAFRSLLICACACQMVSSP